MLSLRTLLAAAPLLALAVAQNIAFTSTPYEAVAGDSYNITWGGGDGTGVTLTLRRGNPQDLSTVDTIADGVREDYYIWTVSDDLESGDDYALQITQGQSDINYSGLFSVVGIDASPSNTTSSTSTSATSSASATDGPFVFGNSTASITSLASAAGTGTAMVRNSTFSSASLTSSSNTHDFNDMTTTSTHSSATRMPSSSSTSAPSNDASVRAGSSAALVLGIFAAIMLH